MHIPNTRNAVVLQTKMVHQSPFLDPILIETPKDIETTKDLSETRLYYRAKFCVY